MRLAAHADVGFLRGVDQAFYRVHGQNMRTSFSDVLDLRQKRLAFEMTLDLYGARLSDARRLSDGVHRRLSRDALGVAARSYDLGTAEPAAVDELVAFAFDCWPHANRFPIYHTLQARRRVSPQAMPYISRRLVSLGAEGARMAAAPVVEIPGVLSRGPAWEQVCFARHVASPKRAEPVDGVPRPQRPYFRGTVGRERKLHDDLGRTVPPQGPSALPPARDHADPPSGPPPPPPPPPPPLRGAER